MYNVELIETELHLMLQARKHEEHFGNTYSECIKNVFQN